MPPVVAWDAVDVDGVLQLTFRDLIEIRFVDAFLEFGVGWKELRAAADRAAELFHTSHPFSSSRFSTDGRSIFAEVNDPAGDRQLVHLRKRQQVFRQVIEPALRGIEFEGGVARRWWPLGDKRQVVIDPTRAFGQPIGVRSGVPASILAAYADHTSVARAAVWYETSEAEVRDAVAFERKRAA